MGVRILLMFVGAYVSLARVNPLLDMPYVMQRVCCKMNELRCSNSMKVGANPPLYID
jgi:hypothetical protein